jgi:hypothetical protein
MVDVSPKAQGLQLFCHRNGVVGENESGQGALRRDVLANRVARRPAWGRFLTAGIVTSCYCWNMRRKRFFLVRAEPFRHD